MATFRKRGPYQWQAQVRKKGQSLQAKTFETRAQAEQCARAIEVEMDKGVFVSRAEAESTTLEELPLLASGSPRRVGFLSSLATFDDRTGGLPWVRRTTSPYPVRLHVSLVLRISGLALSGLLDLLTNTI